MIENFFGFLAVLYLPLLFIVMFLGVVIYRGIVLPYLGEKGYPNGLAYKRVVEYRQIARVQQLMKGNEGFKYIAVVVLKHFERISLRHTYKVLLLWVGFYLASLFFSIIGI